MSETDARRVQVEDVAAMARAELACELLGDLDEGLCAFELCTGPEVEPVPMQTCRVCFTIHRLRGVAATGGPVAG